jgi:hypothetical protein
VDCIFEFVVVVASCLDCFLLTFLWRKSGAELCSIWCLNLSAL